MFLKFRAGVFQFWFFLKISQIFLNCGMECFFLVSSLVSFCFCWILLNMSKPVERFILSLEIFPKYFKLLEGEVLFSFFFLNISSGLWGTQRHFTSFHFQIFQIFQKCSPFVAKAAGSSVISKNYIFLNQFRICFYNLL